MLGRRDAAKSYDHEISALFLLHSLTVFATLGLAVLVYGEPFRFWHDAFSDLGNTVTHGGHRNAAARLIFSVGMTASSAIMLWICSRYAGRRELRHHAVKCWLARLGALGCLISIYPNDIDHTVHSVGVGTVIGAVYLFTMIFHLELKREISPRLFWADLLIMQVAVFSYAWAFFADAASKQSLQKTCIVGLLLAMQRGATAAEKSFQLREVWEVFRRFQH
jgi:hypothetical membrane protein